MVSEERHAKLCPACLKEVCRFNGMQCLAITFFLYILNWMTCGLYKGFGNTQHLPFKDICIIFVITKASTSMDVAGDLKLKGSVL